MKRNLLKLGFLALLYAGVQVSQAQTPVTGMISWTAPTANVDGSTITAALTYQVYLGASGKETKTGNPQTGTSFQITPLPAPGTTICAQVTAIANAVESARSAEACATMPFPTPNSPTVVTIVIH